MAGRDRPRHEVIGRIDNLTLVSACWGDYFDRFGYDWFQSVENLDPQPAHVIVATDRELPLPDTYTQIPLREPYHWDAFNCAAEAATTEWVAALAMDDRLPPNAFADIDMSGDVEASVGIDSNGRAMRPTQAKWSEIMTNDWYPLSGYQVIRREVWMKYPLRPVEWADWIQALEWKAGGVRVTFSDRVRHYYKLHDSQHSRVKDVGVAMERIKLVKDMIRRGGIKPGNTWPPEAA